MKKIIGKNILKKKSDTQELDYEAIAARQAEMKAAAAEAERRAAAEQAAREQRLAEAREAERQAGQQRIEGPGPMEREAGNRTAVREPARDHTGPIAVNGWQKEAVRERKQEEEELQPGFAQKQLRRRLIICLAAGIAALLVVFGALFWYMNYHVSATAITEGEAPVAFYLNHHNQVLDAVPLNEEALKLLKSMGDLGSRPALKAVLAKTEKAMHERGLLAEDEHLKYSVVKGRADIDAYSPPDEDAGAQVNQGSDNGDSDSKKQDDNKKNTTAKPTETQPDTGDEPDAGGDTPGGDTPGGDGGDTPGGDTGGGGDTNGGDDGGDTGGDSGGGDDAGATGGGDDAGDGDNGGDGGDGE